MLSPSVWGAVLLLPRAAFHALNAFKINEKKQKTARRTITRATITEAKTAAKMINVVRYSPKIVFKEFFSSGVVSSGIFSSGKG